MVDKYKNRYGNKYWFEKVDEDTYSVQGELSYWRYGVKEDTDEIVFADPSGGPFIELGMNLAKRPIVRITAEGDDVVLHLGDKDE